VDAIPTEGLLSAIEVEVINGDTAWWILSGRNIIFLPGLPELNMIPIEQPDWPC
jgi:hypothetical protein